MPAAPRTDFRVSDAEALATEVHDFGDVAALIASGSFMTDGMAVVPCSMKTLSGIANSYNENLLNRAADVTLQGGSPSDPRAQGPPLPTRHLDLLRRAADLGAMILPPMVAWYHRPKTLQDIIDQTVGKALDALGVENTLFRRWEGCRNA